MKIGCLIIAIVLSSFISHAQTADFTFTTANGLFCSPQVVTFTQTSTGNPVSFFWNFGNGQSGNNPTETITYNSAGTYTVTLTAIYDNSAVSITKTVVINPSPTISLTADKVSLCQPGTVNFTATGSAGITNYDWDFGDGSAIQTTNTNNISHNFAAYNSFIVSVKGSTADGCSATAVATVTIAKFTITGAVNPTSGCIPVNANLNVNATFPAGDGLQNILWDFDDGSPTLSGTSASVNHSYNTISSITNANVTITSNQGCTNQFTFSTFAFGTPPFGTNAYTAAGRDTFCGSEIIQFNATATNANSYTWNFGDATSASISDTSITHKYTSLGNKQIIVTPFFNGCAGTKDTVNIFIRGVIANFTYANTCATKNRYLFSNQSLGNITHFEWTFSDINPVKDSVNFNPTHVFPSNGSFVAKLLLVDSTTGCVDSLNAAIYTATPAFTSNKNSVCKDSLIIYNVNNSYPAASGHTYEFHVDGTLVDNGSVDSLSFFATTHGTFTDFVVIRDNVAGTCDDTLYIAGNVKVKGPVAAFSSPLRLCADSSVVIVNSSSPYFTSEPITKWLWNFGDNQTDSTKDPPAHRYAASGTYAIKLFAADINGCAQSTTNRVTVNPLPRINILPAVDTLCRGDSSLLKAYSTDSLLWTPDTNISCTTCDSVLVYPVITTNYIGRAMNAFGCKSYDTSLIKVYDPFSLTVSPSDTSICPGGTVQFNLNVTGNTLWAPSTFLNNSTISNPLSLPDTSITYKVTVSDSVGCFTDSAATNIIVYPRASVDAGPDRLLAYGTSFTFTPVYSTNIATYLWTPSGSLSCTNCSTPNGIAFQKQTYQINITDINGCKATDSVSIFITCERSNLLLPNAFTPNRDGLNDYFYPIARGFSVIKRFVIFSRFGKKVFERKDFQPNVASLGWDGIIKGDPNVSTQTFVWIADAVCNSGEIISARGNSCVDPVIL